MTHTLFIIEVNMIGSNVNGYRSAIWTARNCGENWRGMGTNERTKERLNEWANEKLKEWKELLTGLEEIIFGDGGRARLARVLELAENPLRDLLDAVVFFIEFEHVEFLGWERRWRWSWAPSHGASERVSKSELERGRKSLRRKIINVLHYLYCDSCFWWSNFCLSIPFFFQFQLFIPFCLSILHSHLSHHLHFLHFKFQNLIIHNTNLRWFHPFQNLFFFFNLFSPNI